MWVCVFLMVYRWEGPKLNYQHLLHMFTNIGDLWGKICCVSYLRCKGDTRSINGSPLWMFNGLCFLLRVMYSWNAITDYNGTMVNPSTGVYTSMPGMMWICGVSFAVPELQLVATVLWRTTHGNGGFAPAIPYRFTNSWSGSTHGNVTKNQWTNQTNYIDLTRAINSHIVPWNIWWLSPTYGWWLPLNQAGSNRLSQATGAA